MIDDGHNTVTNATSHLKNADYVQGQGASR